MDNPVAKFFAALKDRDIERALRVVAENVVFEAQRPNTIPIYLLAKKALSNFFLFSASFLILKLLKFIN